MRATLSYGCVCIVMVKNNEYNRSISYFRGGLCRRGSVYMVAKTVTVLLELGTRNCLSTVCA